MSAGVSYRAQTTSVLNCFALFASVNLCCNKWLLESCCWWDSCSTLCEDISSVLFFFSNQAPAIFMQNFLFTVLESWWIRTPHLPCFLWHCILPMYFFFPLCYPSFKSNLKVDSCTEAIPQVFSSFILSAFLSSLLQLVRWGKEQNSSCLTPGNVWEGCCVCQ